MRLILSFLFLFTVCTLVHSNTIYRKYREIELPVVPSEEQNVIVAAAELKKDQIPVHIEIIEPVVILNENKPVESARNFDLEPVVAVPVAEDEKRNEPVPELIDAPELAAAPELVVAPAVENLKQSELVAVEQVRSIESSVELKKDESVQVPESPVESVQVPETPAEVAPAVVEAVRNVVIEEKPSEPIDTVPVVVPVVEIQAPSVRNIEADIVPAVEEAVVEPVIVPVAVPVENAVVQVESVRNLEAVGEIVPEVMRKIEQAEEIAVADAEKQSEILNEIIAKETVRNIEPEVVKVEESVVPKEVVVVEIIEAVSVPKEESRSAVPAIEEVKPIEVPDKKVEVELLKEDSEVAKEEIKQKEEIVLRSVDLIEPKPKQEEKIEQLLEKDVKLPEEKLELKEDLKEEELKPKNENVLRVVDEIVPVQKVDEEKLVVVNDKVEEKLLAVNQDESIGSVRQTAESTTPGNVIQQLLQNNPLTNFIQSIRPQTAAAAPAQAPAASNDSPSAEINASPAPAAPAAPTQPPNLIQQIASGIQGGIQGFQANVQGLFQQPAAGSGTTRPPFAFISNLFPGQQQPAQGGTNPPTGGNVPPNPIQGFLGLFNGNRGTTTQSPPTSKTTAALAAEQPQAALVDDKIDAVKESAEETETSNENYAESEQELYVGEEGDSPGLY